MNNYFTTTSSENVLSCLLSVLNVKFTKRYANKLFNEHPHKYNLYGLSSMLSEYKIQNRGVKIEEKEKYLSQLDPPFVAHTGKDFAVVGDVNDDNVTYYLQDQKFKVPISDFLGLWSGITLLVETDNNTVEPEYFNNKKDELVSGVQKALLFSSLIILVIASIVQNGLYSNIGLIILLLFNFAGLYVSYLLILKQMKIKSNSADKICYLFSQGNCNDVLDSPAAKFLGIIGWSELGFSYFLSNLFILLFIPHLLSFVSVINICVLPYSFWSVWYQKSVAKQWCPLCLIVQIIFWSIFLTNLIAGFISIPELSIYNIISVGLIYSIPFLVINLILPRLAEAKKGEKITQEFNAFKMNENIFLSLLKRQPKYDVSKDVSTIYFGNPNANTLITIFTNPHCEPCARMHKRVEQFLSKAGDKFCVQYILSSFSEELKDSNRFLLAVNKQVGFEEKNKIFSEWFDGGKYQGAKFFQKYNVSILDVEAEMESHEKWRENAKLSRTPTILFEGYELPDDYRIEDLIYFSNIVVESN